MTGRSSSMPAWVVRSVGVAVALTAVVLVSGCSAVGPIPVIDADPTSGYAPLTVMFDASDSYGRGGELVAYRWEFGNGETATEAAVSCTYTVKGTYDAVLTVSDVNGRSASRSRTITLLNRTPHAEFTYSPFQAPADHPFRFDATASYDPDGEIVSYLWDFGDGTAASGVRVEHVFSEQRVRFTVTLTVTDDDGVSNSTILYVEPVGCPTCG